MPRALDPSAVDTWYDTVPVGMYRTTPQGRILAVNAALVRLMRAPDVATFLSTPMSALYVDPSDRERWKAALDVSDVVENFETRVRRFDGEVVWIRNSARAVRGLDQAVVWYDGVVEDVTEARAARDALRARVEGEAVLSRFASRFAGPDVEEGIQAALADLGEATDADRAYVFIVREDDVVMDNTHEWCRPGVEPQIANLQGLPCAAVPWWMARMREGGIAVDDVATLPEEASAERALLEAQEIRSVLALPLQARGRLAGFVGLDNVRAPGPWRPESRSVLDIAARLLSAAVERREAEAALRLSERRYRGLVDQSPLSKQILAPDGRTLRVNRAWEELWGVTLAELGEYNVLQDPQLEALGVTAVLRRAFEGEAVILPPVAFVPGQGRHAGREIWTEASAYPVKGDDGSVREVVLVHKDVSERVRSEQALRASEERFRRLFELAPIGMALVGMDGRPQTVNAALSRMLGYSAEELCAMSFADFTHPDDVHSDLEQFKRLLNGEIASYTMLKRYIRRDGTIVWGNLAGALIPAAGATYALGMVEDVTERKRAEAELEAARRQLAVSEKMSALGALVSGVAHEIRTPLTYATNNLHVVAMRLDRAAQDPAQAEAAREMRALVADALEGADRIERLVQSLRGYAQVPPGRRAPEDLRDVVRGAVDLFRATHRGSVDLEVALAPAPGARVDREQFQQVVLNLLTNAAEAAGPRGRVRVVSELAAGRARVAVEDDGPGLAAEVLARAFDPFFTTKPGGTGLGLSISKRIAESHGGTVRYEPRAAGGARFVVEVPVDERSRLMRPEGAEPTSSGASRPSAR